MFSDFGARIKAARKAAGMTQQELAEKIGKGFSTVQKYENGVVEPPTSVIFKIAEVLNLTPLELAETIIPWPAEMQPEMDRRDRYKRLDAAFDTLNDKGQEKAVDYVEDLTKVEDYRK